MNIAGRGRAFVPDKLPPTIRSEDLLHLIVEASNLIGVLNGLGMRLKNPHLLTRPQIMNEAVQSSKIEGLQASLSDLYKYQIMPKKYTLKDTEEVINYVYALETALEKVSSQHEINLEMVNNCHKILLHNTRGNLMKVGQLRTRQNWIGVENSKIDSARYVPPPSDKIPKLMDNLFDFINSPPTNLPPVIRCAIVHYQFEAIHPYEDGNGRIGRLLIPLMLSDMGLMCQPLLYISGYVKRHQREYYDSLLDVTKNGNWNGWIRFFLLSVIHQAKASIELIGKSEKLRDAYMEKAKVKNITATTIKAIELLFKSPLVTVRLVEDECDASMTAARGAIKKLIDIGILEDVSTLTGRKMYVAVDIYELIRKTL